MVFKVSKKLKHIKWRRDYLRIYTIIEVQEMEIRDLNIFQQL